MSVEKVPIGTDAQNVRPGDFILCHRDGFVSRCIRLGERIKYARGARVSHAAFVDDWKGDEPQLIEALTKGVVRTPLSAYRQVEYWLVRTELQAEDQDQAVAFARSCLGQKYGFLIDFAIALRFLTPGRGLWFGVDGTEICSGLVAQAMVRGWANFPVAPSSMSPAELLEHYEDQDA